MENQKPHAIMMPVSHLQGHVTPFVDLAVHLASNGFTVTFVLTQHTPQQMIKTRPNSGAGDIFAGARESGLDVRFATVSDGFPMGFDRGQYHDQFCEGQLHVFPAHVDELVGNIVRSGVDPPLTVLVADTFYGWASLIAKKHNLVHVSFWTQPALVFDVYYHIHLLKSNGHFASEDNRRDVIDYIPGVGSIEPKDLISHLQDTDIQTSLHRTIYKAFDDVKHADFILCNTVQELEPEPVSALLQIQPFYAIGPIFGTRLSKPIVSTSLRSESHCTHWLDTKPIGSILYVSFGSLFQVNESDLLEIAYGLLDCDVSFIWVLRPDTVGFGRERILPVGLEEDLKRKGLIVPWCNQVDVIANQAIGGFLTHCGWNSVLESAWHGVPMLCFPLFTDQLTNRKLVVDDWRAGINLCDGKPIRREEVRDNINRLMSQKSTNEVRENVEKVKDTLKRALGPDGSSTRNLNEFVEAVKNKIQEKP